MKIKGEEYVRLHRLLTNFSNIDIWECLMNNMDLNKMLERVPNEFDLWVRKTINDLKKAYDDLVEYSESHIDRLIEERGGDLPNKKEFAEWVFKQDKKIQSILFKLYDKKDYSNYVWKLIRPTYQKPFWSREV